MTNRTATLTAIRLYILPGFIMNSSSLAIYLKKSKVFKPEFLRNLFEQLKYDNYPNAKISIDKGIEKLIIEV